jgi:hypothetical protein
MLMVILDREPLEVTRLKREGLEGLTAAEVQLLVLTCLHSYRASNLYLVTTREINSDL